MEMVPARNIIYDCSLKSESAEGLYVVIDLNTSP